MHAAKGAEPQSARPSLVTPRTTTAALTATVNSDPKTGRPLYWLQGFAKRQRHRHEPANTKRGKKMIHHAGIPLSLAVGFRPTAKDVVLPEECVSARHVKARSDEKRVAAMEKISR